VVNFWWKKADNCDIIVYMTDEKSENKPKIGGFIFWIICIISAGSITLLITSSRVGQQNDTTYGNLYKNFVGSWGGEISIIPADFYFEESYTETENNVEVKKTKIHYLQPDSILMNSSISLDKKREGLIAFNSFLTDIDNEYILTNNTLFRDNLFLKFNRPENANILYDYLVLIDDRAFANESRVGDSFVVLPEFNQNQKVKINIQFKTKGIDVLKYKLGSYSKYIIQSFKAVFTINTPEYNLLQFGLPHEIIKNGKNERLIIEINNFSTNQDVGISFVSIINDLEQVERLIRFSPVSLCLFMLLVFILSQMNAIKINFVHYLFIGIINIFYFLFIAYIIRFFNIFSTLAFAFLLTSIMYVLYIPNITNKKFAFKILVPYHFALTTILSLLFLLPMYRGVSLIIFLFIVFLSIMVPIGKSDFSKWPILTNKKG
jgi:inner membrane protein involved in colicin E2 resistance